MGYWGQKAIEVLAEAAKSTDLAESSHWKEMNASFGFENGRFLGLRGFGGYSKPYKGIVKQAHRLLQARFRKLAQGYEQFRSLDELATKITLKQNRALDLDVLRQAITLAFLKDVLPIEVLQRDNVCVIGDGFASMTSLLLGSEFAKIVVLVNLNKMLLVDLCFLRLWMTCEQFESQVRLVTDENELKDNFENEASDQQCRVLAIQASRHKILKHCPIGVAINIASMQEMNAVDIASYFDAFRFAARKRRIYFYCCNRKEKRLPDGTVTEFKKYPWDSRDEVLWDDRCPWHQEYYSLIPPFYRPYDGEHRHRLARLWPY